MARDSLMPLWIGNVRIAQGRCDHAMAENPLHLGQVHARRQQVGGAAVPELVHAAKRHPGLARERVQAEADRMRVQTLAARADQQRLLADRLLLFQAVVPNWKKGLQRAQRQLRQRNAALLAGLAAIHAQSAAGAAVMAEVEAHELAASQAAAIQ